MARDWRVVYRHVVERDDGRSWQLVPTNDTGTETRGFVNKFHRLTIRLVSSRRPVYEHPIVATYLQHDCNMSKEATNDRKNVARWLRQDRARAKRLRDLLNEGDFE